MIIYKKFFFEAAHFMPDFPNKHRYNKIHGHSYELIIHLNKKLTTEDNWVVDFEEIEKRVKPLIRKIDHNLLNEIKGLENPTSENLARWFWKKLKPKLTCIDKIEINRPRVGGCIFDGT